MKKGKIARISNIVGWSLGLIGLVMWIAPFAFAWFLQNKAVQEAAAIGIIGGADGPTSIYLTSKVGSSSLPMHAWLMGIGILLITSSTFIKKRSK